MKTKKRMPPGILRSRELIPLSELTPGEEAIVRVYLWQWNLHPQLRKQGLVMGAKVKVVEDNPNKTDITLVVSNEQIRLPRFQASTLLVKLL